jgi:uncharacterized protein (DUF1684 family)
MNMRFFFPALLALMIVSAVGCSSPKPDDKDYASQVATDRAYKDAMFLKGDDPEYNVPASLKPSDDQTVIPMPTSSGSPRQMRKAGALEFTLKGQPFSITAFVDLSDRNLDHLTVMFSDLTSGTETYNSGRYIDLNRSPTGVYALDFNRAYHPYCYYNGSYECPIPPRENRLKIPIRAGERLKVKT